MPRLGFGDNGAVGIYCVGLGNDPGSPWLKLLEKRRFTRLSWLKSLRDLPLGLDLVSSTSTVAPLSSRDVSLSFSSVWIVISWWISFWRGSFWFNAWGDRNLSFHLFFYYYQSLGLLKVLRRSTFSGTENMFCGFPSPRCRDHFDSKRKRHLTCHVAPLWNDF